MNDGSSHTFIIEPFGTVDEGGVEEFQFEVAARAGVDQRKTIYGAADPLTSLGIGPDVTLYPFDRTYQPTPEQLGQAREIAEQFEPGNRNLTDLPQLGIPDMNTVGVSPGVPDRGMGFDDLLSPANSPARVSPSSLAAGIPLEEAPFSLRDRDGIDPTDFDIVSAADVEGMPPEVEDTPQSDTSNKWVYFADESTERQGAFFWPDEDGPIHGEVLRPLMEAGYLNDEEDPAILKIGFQGPQAEGTTPFWDGVANFGDDEDFEYQNEPGTVLAERMDTAEEGDMPPLVAERIREAEVGSPFEMELVAARFKRLDDDALPSPLEKQRGARLEAQRRADITAPMLGLSARQLIDPRSPGAAARTSPPQPTVSAAPEARKPEARKPQAERTASSNIAGVSSASGPRSEAAQIEYPGVMNKFKHSPWKTDLQLEFAVADALRASDSVHSAPTAHLHRQIPIKKIPRSQAGPEAAYTAKASTKPSQFGPEFADEPDIVPEALLVDPNGERTRLSILHEVGHFLDHDLFGKGEDLGARVGAFNEIPVIDAIQASPSWKALDERSTHLYDGMTPVEAAQMGDWYGYAASPEESFARAYAQYIATRTDNEGVREEWAAYQREAPEEFAAEQWKPEEFKPIAAAFDKIFQREIPSANERVGIPNRPGMEVVSMTNEERALRNRREAAAE